MYHLSLIIYDDTNRTGRIKSTANFGEIFSREIELPEDHLVTISRVDVAPDLKTAKVYISVLPFDSSEDVIKMIQSQRASIQKMAHEKLSMKFSPVFEFILDTKQEEASEMERLIDQEMELFDV